MDIRCKYDALVPVGHLKPHPKNANAHSPEQVTRLAKLIKYQGVRAPIVVSNRSGFMAKGHCTLLAIIENGGTTAPVVYQDFDSEEQEIAFLHSDNNIAGWSEMDLSRINADMIELGPDFDVELFGLRDFQIEIADKDLGDEGPGSLPADPKTVSGDLWCLGEHRLLCGDATIVTDVEKLMGTDKADIVWTDPPYNVNYEGKTKDALTIENDQMDDEKFYEFLYQAFANMFLATKPGGAIYIAHADSEGLNFRRAMKGAGWLLKQCLIWVKQQFVMGRQDYHWRHEPILYGWAPGAAHNWCGDRKQSTVLEFDRPSRSEEHPTMKPLDLIEYCLGNSSPQGAVVLDTFGGSGSTLMACEKTHRVCRTMELDPKYCDVILARWVKATGGDPVRGDGIKWSELQT